MQQHALLAFILSLVLCCSAFKVAAEPAPEQTETQDTEQTPEQPAEPTAPLDPTPAETDSSGQTELKPRLPLDELRMFVEAFSRISDAYVEEIDDRTLLENAIKGMLAQLDPHSAYLDQESLTGLQETTSGNYGGLGIEIDMEDGFVNVIAPMDDTPASRAGIESGDLIIQLDGQPVKGLSIDEAITIMRGEPGSEIKLSVVKAGASAPTDITLTREIIKVASVRQRIIEDGYGYLRIAQFQGGTGEEVETAVRELEQAGQLKGLVIDLRNNPGGVLQAAVTVSDIFINEGLIVYTDGRIDNADLRYKATRPDLTGGVPVVVLVNGGTASASEIVAGALQDHGRAVVMGTTTFGKGSVQTILPLSADRAIKLTTARYYTPNGRSIQAEGIVPDIWVARSRVTSVETGARRVKEKDLPKHLSAIDNTSAPATGGETEPKAALSTRDYQLNEALTLLKGLNILARAKNSGG